MKKVLYNSKPQGAFLEENFSKLMNALWPESILMSGAYPLLPNPHILPEIGSVVKIWHPENVWVLYLLKYGWKDKTCQDTEEVLAKAVLFGNYTQLGGVEKKILGGINRAGYNQI
jgi:hypothetical protein